jgi:hypothetical protein
MKKALFILMLLGVMHGLYSLKGDAIQKTVRLMATDGGFIINSEPMLVEEYIDGPQGRELRVGWDESGSAMRSFLTFDMKPISALPEQDLIIDWAVLKVFEANTNLHPFNGDGNRNVKVDFLDFGTLDATDFDLEETDYCGVIAKDGYNVLEEYSLDVTRLVASQYEKGSTTDSESLPLQFRLQLSKDENTYNENLMKSHWSFFSKDEQEYTDYVPVLIVGYTLINK